MRLITITLLLVATSFTAHAQLEGSFQKQDTTEVKGIRSNILLNLLYSDALFLELDLKAFPFKSKLLKHVYVSPLWGTYGIKEIGDPTNFNNGGFTGGSSMGWQKKFLKDRLEPKATLFWITFAGQSSDAAGLHLSFGYDIKKWLSVSGGTYGQLDTDPHDNFDTERIAWENGIIINISKHFRTVLRTSGDTGGFGLDGQIISRQLLEIQYVFPLAENFHGNIKCQFGYDYRNAKREEGQATFLSLVGGFWFNNSRNKVQ